MDSIAATTPLSLHPAEPGMLAVPPEMPVSPGQVQLPDSSDADIANLLTGDVKETVLRVTQELFPGKIGVRFDDDPEYPGYRYTVIEAQAAGEIAEIVRREIEWHRRIVQLSPALVSLRLSLLFR